MNHKQLAYVLIKVLGLSWCVQSIPSIASAVVSAILSHDSPRVATLDYWIYPLVSLAIGAFLISSSKAIVERLIPTESE